MSKDKKLFFIALLPPKPIRQEIDGIKSYFARVYQSSAALKSPAHITLQPPFEWESTPLAPIATGPRYPLLSELLESFANKLSPIPVITSGFGSFKPRVIYINVVKTKELLAIHKDLQIYCQKYLNISTNEPKNRSFKPHLTVAYRDLTKTNFYKAWQEFELRSYDCEFLVSKLTLLNHNGKQWKIDREFEFKGLS